MPITSFPMRRRRRRQARRTGLAVLTLPIRLRFAAISFVGVRFRSAACTSSVTAAGGAVGGVSVAGVAVGAFAVVITLAAALFLSLFLGVLFFFFEAADYFVVGRPAVLV